jgi:hypothetical protein
MIRHLSFISRRTALSLPQDFRLTVREMVTNLFRRIKQIQPKADIATMNAGFALF